MHPKILKRVGIILVIIGALDIAYMIYCIANKISYSSSFNIFSVIAGMFLFKGSLKAASFVRWFAAFLLGGFATLLVVFPFFQPVNLTITQVELNPGKIFVACVFMLFVSAVLYWLVHELGRDEVLQAIKTEGGKIRSIKFAIGCGILLVMLLAVCIHVLMSGESAGKASAIALKEAGSGYKAHVTSLNISKSSSGTTVSGIVTVWNKNEIRTIPVSWRE
ncbi:MAG: hypothetical protein ABWY06_13545 [Pseudomonas sp.]|uniref:hypothetical protein n=1 Tax=Pseudomonas sp. TaxID=306 RepID=UPI003395F40C